MAKHFDRRSVRLKYYDYSSEGAYFVTICTQNRGCLFGEIVDSEMQLNDGGTMVETVWTGLPNRFTSMELDEWVIMPNHMHGIIAISNPNHVANVGAIHELPLHPSSRVVRRNMLLPRIIGYFKMNTAKRINVIRETPGQPIWQRNYYEHVIRNEEELYETRKYIQENPLKWELDPENVSLKPRE